MTRARRPTPPSVSAGSERNGAEQFALDVSYYLTLAPRQLPSRYLYDALGSALFEAISRLPWYGITEAEKRLLAISGQEALRLAGSIGRIVELGSGSGEKLELLLERHDRPERLDVHLIDVSTEALQAAERAIESAASRVTLHQARYEEGLSRIAEASAPDGATLVLFLGSNIGNYDPPGANALLQAIRAGLRAGDALLLGADLVKPARDLLLAYDDPLGVTAAFNRNLLVRINRELDGDFDVGAFAHRAVWNAPASRVEMHLVAQSPQEVHVPAAGLRIAMTAGEWIWTESCYKYRPAGIARLLEAAHFGVARQWIDEPTQFALTLARAM